MSNSTNDDDLNLKSNKIFAEELKRWGMILELYFADDIKDKMIINKNDINDLNNKIKQSHETNKNSKNENNHH